MTGGGKVHPIPIAMSLATAFFSAITILTTPVEFFNYGTMFFYFSYGILKLDNFFDNSYKKMIKYFIFKFKLHF
jgi:Na+/proline symporter